MNLLKRSATAAALGACLLLMSACSISINTSSTPTPSPSPEATSTAKPVSAVITSQLDSGRCESSANVTIDLDGRDVGTMNVVNQLIQTDRLTVMVAPGTANYTLKGTAFVQTNGQSSGLKVTGQGQVPVNDGPNNWTLEVDGTRLAPGVCPSPGSSWPLVLQPS